MTGDRPAASEPGGRWDQQRGSFVVGAMVLNGPAVVVVLAGADPAAVEALRALLAELRRP